MAILTVLLESPKFAGDSAGCHCLGRVPRGAKQHDLDEAAAHTHVTMGFWDKLGSDRFVPLPRKSAPNNSNNSECCWMFVALRRFAPEREGDPLAGAPVSGGENTRIGGA